MSIQPPRSLEEFTDLRLLSNWCQQTAVVPSADTVDGSILQDDAVQTRHILDQNVTTAKLANQAITTAKIDDDAVSDGKLRNSVALSVIGRSGNSTGDPADIAAASNGQYLLRRANVLAFDTIDDADIPATIARDAEVAAGYQPLAAVLSMLHTGTGSPETVVTATVGHLYLRSDGGAGTSLYVKESGAGNTGWVGK